MAVVPGWPRKAAGFPSIWLDRMKAYVDSRPSSAEPGTPVELAVAPGLTPFGDNPPAATANADGSVSLRGGFVVHGPQVSGSINVLTLVPPFLPERLLQFPLAGIFVSGGPEPAALSISITTGGTVALMVPTMVQGNLMEVWLDSVTYWPASA